MSKKLLQSEKTTKQIFDELNNLVNRYDLPNDLETLLLELIDRYRGKTVIGTDDVKMMMGEEPLQIMSNNSCQSIESRTIKLGFANYLNGYAHGANTMCEGIRKFINDILDEDDL